MQTLKDIRHIYKFKLKQKTLQFSCIFRNFSKLPSNISGFPDRAIDFPHLIHLQLLTAYHNKINIYDQNLKYWKCITEVITLKEVKPLIKTNLPDDSQTENFNTAHKRSLIFFSLARTQPVSMFSSYFRSTAHEPISLVVVPTS